MSLKISVFYFLFARYTLIPKCNFKFWFWPHHLACRILVLQCRNKTHTITVKVLTPKPWTLMEIRKLGNPPNVQFYSYTISKEKVWSIRLYAYI